MLLHALCDWSCMALLNVLWCPRNYRDTIIIITLFTHPRSLLMGNSS